MEKSKGKYYYSNQLANQNITAKTNLVWEFLLINNKKIYVFLCIDIHTNYVVNFTVSGKQITTKSIVRKLKASIDERFIIPPKILLIIHTDRGSHSYFQFTKIYKNFFLPSMSRYNTPTDNAVAERFMRTFKDHQIDGLAVHDKLNQAALKDLLLKNI